MSEQAEWKPVDPSDPKGPTMHAYTFGDGWYVKWGVPGNYESIGRFPSEASALAGIRARVLVARSVGSRTTLHKIDRAMNALTAYRDAMATANR